MKGTKHIFFDLDHTLWDYDTNARKVLLEIYDQFSLSEVSTTGTYGFLKNYFLENARLWHAYNLGKIDRGYIRKERFKNVLKSIGISGKLDEMGLKMNDYFVEHCPRQTAIMDGAQMALDYLCRKYPMSIITNGFDDIQAIKLEKSGLAIYFDLVVTSETTGFKKPSREIFDYALEQVGVDPRDAVMVGDNPTADIEGAANAGIVPIFYDPNGAYKSTTPIQINHLTELIRLL